MYSQTEDQIIFSPNEREFTKKAAKITQGDLVVNSPFDGSMFAYQAYGMNTMFRSARTPATTESENIRLDLSNYEANSPTRQAVNSTGAKYVLQLDAGHAPFTTNWPYHNTDWVGIDSVNDSSAGFELVLSDQDMKLYRIQPQ